MSNKHRPLSSNYLLFEIPKQFFHLFSNFLFGFLWPIFFGDKNFKKNRQKIGISVFPSQHKLQKSCKHTSQQKSKFIHENVKENFLLSSGKRQLIQISFTLVEPRVAQGKVTYIVKHDFKIDLQIMK